MVRIYVATHRPDNCLLKLTDPIYIPIYCGKALNRVFDNPEEYLPELGDDTGDNISEKNPHYCELTAMYWIWKNDDSSPDDVVGLNHYRRYFSEPESDLKLLTEETINSLLGRSDFIVNGCGTDFDHTQSDDESAYAGYKQNNIIKDLDNALDGVKTLFPDLYDKVEHEVKHSGAMCLCNMMICKKKYFDEYCEFLFPVLEYVESKIDFNDGVHQGYFGRALGFLGERLFRPWLKATGHTGIQGRGLNWEQYSGYIWR